MGLLVREVGIGGSGRDQRFAQIPAAVEEKDDNLFGPIQWFLYQRVIMLRDIAVDIKGAAVEGRWADVAAEVMAARPVRGRGPSTVKAARQSLRSNLPDEQERPE